MMPNVPVAQMTSPAWASGIQPAGNRARRIKAASATWRMTGNIPCLNPGMARVVAPPKAQVKASDGPELGGNKPGLDRNAAVQNDILAGGVFGVVARQPQHNAGDFFRRADPAHRLAGSKGLARRLIVSGVAQALLQRRRIHRAGADRVATDALGDKIRR